MRLHYNLLSKGSRLYLKLSLEYGIPQANHHPVVARYPCQSLLGLGISLRIAHISLILSPYLQVFPEATYKFPNKFGNKSFRVFPEPMVLPIMFGLAMFLYITKAHIFYIFTGQYISTYNPLLKVFFLDIL